MRDALFCSRGLGYPRSHFLTVSGSRTELRRAALAWAADLGWKRQGPTLVFVLERMSLLPVSVEVTILEGEDGTTAVFTALLPVSYGRGGPYLGEGTPAEMAGYLDGVGAGFVAGTTYHLRRHVTEQERDEEWRGQSRLVALERWRRRLVWPFMAFGPIVLLIVLAGGKIDNYVIAAWAAALWLGAVFATHFYLRWWMLGAKYHGLLVIVIPLWTAVAILFGFAASG